MKKQIFTFIAIALLVQVLATAQVINPDYFEKITFQVDTSSYFSSRDTVHYQGRNYMFFRYLKENETCDVKIFPSHKHKVKDISLVESADFSVVDSMVNFNNQYYSFKVRFHHLSTSDFLRFRLNLEVDSSEILQDIPLLPITQTSVQLKTRGEDLSVGEEKVFELTSNHPENIRPVPEWHTTPDFDYRVTENNGQLFLHLLANGSGAKTASISLQTFKPCSIDQTLTCQTQPLSCSFNVKAVGLIFLQTDKTEFILDDKSKNEGVEVQMDNNKFLQLNSVYLVEAQKESGSPLIAEIFTRERISNDKVLCVIRTFNYHRKTDGYLYVKDNNTARFISNFNVIPKVNIEHIKIMRNGKDWTEDATIYPGETINLRLEGQSLDKARFRFGELINLSSDSIERNESFAEFKLKIPLTISKKSVEIFNANQNTGKYLTVKEYQKAHPFDYINIRFGNKRRNLTDITGPELYSKTIKDVIISFHSDKIDSISKLYGKQYLNIDVKVLGKKDEIIDMATIEDFAICPGEKSPRYQFYDKSDCKNNDISINSKISNTTYDLSDWSKIKLTFKNPTDKYAQDAQNKSVEIVLQKLYKFDIDVSFPTGLLIKRANSSNYSNFGGVSMAIIGQYSFYEKDKINHLKPYKFGAGFLALNAFDYSNDGSSRDLGAVVLGTLNPINTDRKLTFSIYLGGGYLLSAKTLFWLIGPGISVSI